MKKSDLKDGMIVELRNGDICIVLGDKLLDTNDYAYIDGYDDDLTDEYQKDLDIVKVYKDKSLCGLESRYERDNLKLLWEREDKIDWTKVEFGTKVRVWDKGESLAYEGLFLEYVSEDEECPFRVYSEDIKDVVMWECCELA